MFANIKNKFEENRIRKNVIKKIKKAGVWFIDIPRTSSSSIKVELGNKFGFPYGKNNLLEQEYSTYQLLNDHITANEMQEYIGEKNWNSIFTFSIVRNPWERTFSLYNYRKIKKNIPEEWDFHEYVTQLEKHQESPSIYFEESYFNLGAYDYIYSNDGRCLVKQIVRFENRTSDLSRISKIIGIDKIGELHLQSSLQTDNYREHYTDETKEMIAIIYKKDIDTFHYTF